MASPEALEPGTSDQQAHHLEMRLWKPPPHRPALPDPQEGTVSRSIKIVCDGCGKTKQEANRWWSVAISERSTDHEPVLLIEPFHATLPQGSRDFCGQDCALKFISEQMGKVAEPRPEIRITWPAIAVPPPAALYRDPAPRDKPKEPAE